MTQKTNTSQPIHQDATLGDIFRVLARIAESLEERNLREERLYKLEEKLRKLGLKEAQQKLKTALDENSEAR